MMSAGTAFARAASQPRVRGVRSFAIGADTSRHHRAIKQNRLHFVDASLAPPPKRLGAQEAAKRGPEMIETGASRRPWASVYSGNYQ